MPAIRLKLKWLWEWERQINFFIVYQLAKVYSQDKAWPGMNIPVIFIGHGKEVNIYYSSQIIDKSRMLAKKIENNSNFIVAFKKEMVREKRELDAYCLGLSQISSYKKLNKNELIKVLKKFNKLYRQHGVVLIRTLNKVGPKTVEDFISKKYDKTKVANFLQILFSPPRESVERISEKELLKLADKVKKLKNLTQNQQAKRLIKSYLSKFQWLPCGYANEKSLTETEIIKKIKSILKNKLTPAFKLKRLDQEFQQNLKEKKDLLKKLKLPKNIYNLAEALSEFTSYKDYIRMNYNKLHFYLKPLFQETAERLKISYDDLTYLAVPEMILFLNKGSVDQKIISQRKRYFVCFTQKDKIFVVTGKSAKSKERTVKAEVKKDERLIQGLVAYAGRIKGRVKIIKKLSEVKNFKKGDILVTPMTTPELVPTAKKSIAIITDEGGITCHAAIVSRELKIPCIVGTKIATKTLHDDQLVEVDATKGVVKIIKQ